MMDAKYLSKMIVPILFLTFYLVIPIFSSISTIGNIAKKKKFLSIAGEPIHIDSNRNRKMLSPIIPIVILLIGFCFLMKNWFEGLLIIVQGLFALANTISIQSFSRINGLYENGIIQGEYIAWSKINSMKRINNKTISILFETGSRSDYSNVNDIEELVKTLKSKGIKEESVLGIVS